MGLFKNILLTLLVFFNLILEAQWSVIPKPSPPSFEHQYGGYPSVSFPGIILPIGNNKIIYAGNVQNSPSGGGYVMAYKVDDFGNKTQVYYSGVGTGGNPFMIGAASYNDSTVCFSHNVFNYGVGYTNNGFKNSSFCSVGGADIFSIFNTTRHLFILSPCLYHPLDTLMLKRVNVRALNVDTVFYFSQYHFGYPDYPRISFINDSTGFILTKYKSNTAKTVLLKTEDYGNNWSEIITDSIDRISSYSFPSSRIGYVLKGNGSVHKTVNGGSVWIQISSANTSTNCVKFSNDSIGYIGGANGTLLKTINGGTVWSAENTGTTETIKDIYTFGDSVYFLTTVNKLFKNKPQPVHKDIRNNLLVYPNPSNNVIYVEFIKENLGNLTITVTNVFGKELYRQEQFTQDLTFASMINVQSYAEGIYFLNINHAGNNSRQKFIVTK